MYNHIDDDNEFYSTILEGISDCPFNVHEMSKKVFIPFDIKDQFDTPLTEIDPDMQFYLASNHTKNTKLLKTFSKFRSRREHYQCLIWI